MLVEVFSSVKKADKYILAHESTKTYLPIEGDPFFLDQIGQLILGSTLFSANQERISTIQTIEGIGALQLAGAF